MFAEKNEQVGRIFSTKHSYKHEHWRKSAEKDGCTQMAPVTVQQQQWSQSAFDILRSLSNKVLASEMIHMSSYVRLKEVTREKIITESAMPLPSGK